MIRPSALAKLRYLIICRGIIINSEDRVDELRENQMKSAEILVSIIAI